jgi:predicted nucleotidyltransferase
MDARNALTKQLTDEQLDEIVRRLVAALSPRRIFLFGSHAYGDPHPDSDIDLMIVTDDDVELSVDFLKRAYACLRRSFLPFELHFRTLSRFERRSSVRTSLEHEVSAKGRILHAA